MLALMYHVISDKTVIHECIITVEIVVLKEYNKSVVTFSSD